MKPYFDLLFGKNFKKQYVLKNSNNPYKIRMGYLDNNYNSFKHSKTIL